MRCAPWATPQRGVHPWRSGSLKQMHLAQATAPNHRLRSEEQPPDASTPRTVLANDFSQPIGHADRKRPQASDARRTRRQRREPTVAPAALQGLELAENRITHGVDRGFALAGEPEAKVGQIRRRILPANLHRVLGRLDVHADPHAYPTRMDLRGDTGRARSRSS